MTLSIPADEPDAGDEDLGPRVRRVEQLGGDLGDGEDRRRTGHGQLLRGSGRASTRRRAGDARRRRERDGQPGPGKRDVSSSHARMAASAP